MEMETSFGAAFVMLIIVNSRHCADRRLERRSER